MVKTNIVILSFGGLGDLLLAKPSPCIDDSNFKKNYNLPGRMPFSYTCAMVEPSGISPCGKAKCFLQVGQNLLEECATRLCDQVMRTLKNNSVIFLLSEFQNKSSVNRVIRGLT